MEKKRSKGVTIFAILLILDLSFNASGLKLSEFKFLYQPLSEQIIKFIFVFDMFMISIAIISSIGLFWLKNIFKVIIIYWAFYNLFSYLVLLPLIVVKNLPDYFVKVALGRAAEIPEVSSSLHNSYLWISFIAGAIFSIALSISVIYFFTHPKVKEQFK